MERDKDDHTNKCVLSDNKCYREKQIRGMRIKKDWMRARSAIMWAGWGRSY